MFRITTAMAAISRNFLPHVLIGKQLLCRMNVLFSHASRPLFSAVSILSLDELGFYRSERLPYPGENYFENAPCHCERSEAILRCERSVAVL